MKRTSFGKLAMAAAAAAVPLIGFTAQSAHATELWWSANGTTVGGALTGATAWNTTNAHWGTSNAGPFTTVWNNGNVDSATFEGTSGTVNINAGTATGTAIT